MFRGRISFVNFIKLQGFFSSKPLLTEADAETAPISSPLVPTVGPATDNGKSQPAAGSKPSRVQAVKKGIRQVDMGPNCCHFIRICL